MKMAHQRAETCSETKSVVVGIVAPTVIFDYSFVDFKLIKCISVCCDKAIHTYEIKSRRTSGMKEITSHGYGHVGWF
jgi:hypothetical protein